MMKILLPCLVLAAVIAGCGQSLEQKVVGSWKVDTAKTTLKSEALKDDVAQSMLKFGLESITIDLKADKTCSMMLILPLEGTWTLTGNRISITPTGVKNFKFNGKPTMDLNVDPSGTSMSSPIDYEGVKGTLTLTKIESAK